MRKILLILLLTVILTSLTSCVHEETPTDNVTVQNDKRLKIVATIFPCFDFARAVVKDRAELTMLIKPGAEIHTFDPSPADILSINNADVLIYIGGESDTWIAGILESIDASSDKKIIRLMDYVEAVPEEIKEGMTEDEGDKAKQENNKKSSQTESKKEYEYDEHIWTSFKNAILLVNAISSELCETDEANAEFYRGNASTYVSEIKSLGEEITSTVNEAKVKTGLTKIIVADRFPFRYFADELGLDYSAAFGGCSYETDCSAETLAYLIDTVRNEKKKYIYYVENSNRNIANIISEQTGAKPLLLHACQNPSKAEFDAGVTFVSLMKQNAENLRKGLLE